MTSTPVTTASPPPASVPKDDRTIFGWCMYDWANSAYVTTVTVTLLPVYFADVVVGSGGSVSIAGRLFAPDSLWGMAVGTAAFITFIAAPILGSIADYSAAKKRFLLAFAYTGSLFTVLLYFCTTGEVMQTLAFFLVSQICFIAANVFYDAFLPQLATGSELDRISARGYAFGYVGGGLHFALSLLFVWQHAAFGVPRELAMRIALASAGLWWAGFTLFTLVLVREPTRPAEEVPEKYRGWPRPLALLAIGISRPLRTTMRVRRFRHLVIFLIAFMLYDDGIQTVINMAAIYGRVELKLPAVVLMLTVLIIQLIAAGGAVVFRRISQAIDVKPAIMLTLVIWTGVVLYAYFIDSATEFFILGVLVGLVLGGSQALSRSFYASMVPPEASAEFFAFYTVFSKFSSIWGPWVFAFMKQMTGSSRLAILSIGVFFLAGLLLLYFVDEKKAREARLAGAF